MPCPSATTAFLSAAAQLAFTTAAKAEAAGRWGSGGSRGVGFHTAVGGAALPAEVQSATQWQHGAAAAVAPQSVRSLPHGCLVAKGQGPFMTHNSLLQKLRRQSIRPSFRTCIICCVYFISFCISLQGFFCILKTSENNCSVFSRSLICCYSNSNSSSSSSSSCCCCFFQSCQDSRLPLWAVQGC